MANRNLQSAKAVKNDEFYTQFNDIQKEIQAYLDYDKDVFKGKVVYCNCDDPFESNFFRYFVLNFKNLGLKRLITTSYKPSPIANTELILQPSLLLGEKDKIVSEPIGQKGRPKVTANKFIINEVHDIDGDGEFNLKDIAKQLKANKHNEWMPLEGDGDFRSDESINLLKQSDIVVTNPPFSLFREYIKQLVDYNKKFLIIGNINAITYKEVFPLLKENKVWLGESIHSGDREFIVPHYIFKEIGNWRTDENGVHYARVMGVRWFTNLDHGRRHQPLQLMTETEVIKFTTKKPFDKYDNYEAIEVPLVKNIPSDYNGVMGVPISFLDKYNPEQFEILGSDAYDGSPPTKKYSNKVRVVDGVRMKSNTGTMGCVIKESDFGSGTYFDVGYPVRAVYKRIFIRHKKN